MKFKLLIPMIVFLIMLMPLAFAIVIDDFESGVVSGWSTSQPASPLVIADASDDFVISGNFSAKGSGTDGTQLARSFTSQDNGTLTVFINLNATTAYEGFQLSIRDSNNIGTSLMGIRISNESNADTIFTLNGSTKTDTGTPITLGIHKFSVTKFPNASIIIEWDDVELFRGVNNFLFIIDRLFIDVVGIAQGGFSIFYVDNITIESINVPEISLSISDTNPNPDTSIQITATCTDTELSSIVIENDATGSFQQVASASISGSESTYFHNHTTVDVSDPTTVTHRFTCTNTNALSVQDSIPYTTRGLLPLERVSTLVGMVVLFLIILGTIFGGIGFTRRRK